MTNKDHCRPGAPDYALLCSQTRALAEASKDCTAVLANASALLYDAMEGVNWAGFYLVKEEAGAASDHGTAGEALIVGPFQGRPACVRIEKGRGVCGTCWERGETQVIPDVHEFPGHIACDSASNSEIVIPMRTPEGRIFGVLDIDSTEFGRFSDEDAAGLTSFAEVLEEIICG